MEIEELVNTFSIHSGVYEEEYKKHKSLDAESTQEHFNLPEALMVICKEICQLKDLSKK